MIAAADKIILLCDHSKIGKVSFAQFATTETLNVLVTDRIEEADRLLLEKNGVEVLTAPPA